MAESLSNRFTEFLVDFLGGLVPGLVFTFMATTAFAIPAATLFVVAVETNTMSDELILGALELLNGFNLALIGFIVVISYVFGHLFFRQTPKSPDEASYNFIRTRMSPEEQRHWVVQPDPEGNADVQFPYLHVHEYLEARNMSHLARLVPWRGDEPETHIYRSKQFINMLKIRLYYYVPERCGRIIRNEAHIRLISSLWYLTRGLRRVYLASVIIYVIGIAIMVFQGISDLTFPLSIPLLCIAVIGAVSESMRRVMERFFHYQRVREVFYVLETAYIAGQENPRILEHLQV